MKAILPEYQTLTDAENRNSPTDSDTIDEPITESDASSSNGSVDYHELLSQLNQFDRDRELYAASKSKLSKLYIDVIHSLTEAGYTDLIKQVQNNFAPSNKWPKLILHTSFILGSPGALGVILSMFCALKHLAICATPIALTIYIPAILLAVPYYLKKSKDDVSKEELVERISELILSGKAQTISLMENKPNLLKDINLKISNATLPSSRVFFNSSALHTFYMFTGVISLIGGGLLLFSLVSPAAIAVTCAAAVLFSIFYYKTNSTFINGFNQKKYKNTLLRHEIAHHETKASLFQPTSKTPEDKLGSSPQVEMVATGK